MITGPCLGDRSKPELANMTIETPAILRMFGVKTAVCTDHPETPIQYLPLCAAMALRGGMDPEGALACITINAAQLAGIDDPGGFPHPRQGRRRGGHQRPPPQLAQPGASGGHGR